jgi:hypothetical protein
MYGILALCKWATPAPDMMADTFNGCLDMSYSLKKDWQKHP